MVWYQDLLSRENASLILVILGMPVSDTISNCLGKILLIITLIPSGITFVLMAQQSHDSFYQILSKFETKIAARSYLTSEKYPTNVDCGESTRYEFLSIVSRGFPKSYCTWLQAVLHAALITILQIRNPKKRCNISEKVDKLKHFTIEMLHFFFRLVSLQYLSPTCGFLIKQFALFRTKKKTLRNLVAHKIYFLESRISFLQLFVTFKVLFRHL